MASSSPCVSKSRSHTGFLWGVFALILQVTGSAQIRHFNYKRIESATTGLSQARTVAKVASNLISCARECSKSSNCTAIVWDSTATSCSVGVFVNSGGSALASSSSLYIIKHDLTCRFDLGYELRSYNYVIRCLRISNDLRVYGEAKSKCISDGGRLYKANSGNLVNLVKEMIIDKGLDSHFNEIIVGLDDPNNDGRYVWSDGQPLTKAEIDEVFSPGQPDDNLAGEECGEIRISYGWKLNDYTCTQPLNYVCEMAT